MVAICNLGARCHYKLHTAPLRHAVSHMLMYSLDGSFVLIRAHSFHTFSQCPCGALNAALGWYFIIYTHTIIPCENNSMVLLEKSKVFKMTFIIGVPNAPRSSTKTFPTFSSFSSKSGTGSVDVQGTFLFD